MRMLELLNRIIGEKLPGLFSPASRHEWRSVHVTYHPPRVERLWVQIDYQHRLFLHRIYPCHDEFALFHPHPWPSAVRVVSGRYEHRVGTAGTVLVKEVLVPGSEYQMMTRQTWHSVRPLDGPSDSIMLVGEPYKPPVEMPLPPAEKQGPLVPERFEELMAEWHDRFDAPVECGTCGWQGRHSELACYRDDDGAPVEMEHARCPNCFDEDQVMSRR